MSSREALKKASSLASALEYQELVRLATIVDQLLHERRKEFNLSELIGQISADRFTPNPGFSSPSELVRQDRDR